MSYAFKGSGVLGTLLIQTYKPMSILKCNQGFEHSNALHVVERALNELTLKPIKSSKAANTAIGTSANDYQEMP